MRTPSKYCDLWDIWLASWGGKTWPKSKDKDKDHDKYIWNWSVKLLSFQTVNRTMCSDMLSLRYELQYAVSMNPGKLVSRDKLNIGRLCWYESFCEYWDFSRQQKIRHRFNKHIYFFFLSFGCLIQGLHYAEVEKRG